MQNKQKQGVTGSMEVRAAMVSLRKMGLWPKGHGQITRCGWEGAITN